MCYYVTVRLTRRKNIWVFFYQLIDLIMNWDKETDRLRRVERKTLMQWKYLLINISSIYLLINTRMFISKHLVSTKYLSKHLFHLIKFKIYCQYIRMPRCCLSFIRFVPFSYWLDLHRFSLFPKIFVYMTNYLYSSTDVEMLLRIVQE